MESTTTTINLKRDLVHQQHHLKEAVSIAVKEDCDLFIVSKENKIFLCQRSLLVLYSPLISSILSDLPCCLSPTIFLPNFQQLHIKKFLHLLGSGQAIFDQNINTDMKIIAKIAQVLQIPMTELNIGTYRDNPLDVPFQIKKELNNFSVKEEIKAEVEELNVKQETESVSQKDEELCQCEELCYCEYVEEDENEKTSSDKLKTEEADTAHSKVSFLMETTRASSSNEEDLIELNYEDPNLEEPGNISRKNKRQEQTEELSVQVPGETGDKSNDGEKQGSKSRQNSDDRLGFISAVNSLSHKTAYRDKFVSSRVTRRGSPLATSNKRTKVGDLHVNDAVDTCIKSASKQSYDQNKMTVKVTKVDDYGQYDSMSGHVDSGGMIDPNMSTPIASAGGVDGNKEMVSAIRAKMYRGQWECTDCDYSSNHKNALSRHIDAQHLETRGLFCSICNKFCPTWNALCNHKSRFHRRM